MSEAVTPARAVSSYGERNPSAPTELDAFAFLVGKWDGTGRTRLPDGTVAEFAVGWIGRYVLDGRAIADEFHSSAPDGSPYLGISLRQYDGVAGSWVIEYINVTHSFLRRQVNAKTGSVVVDGTAVIVLSQSPDMWSRETYRVTSPDEFSYTIDLSSDAGRNWTLSQIEMSFSRRA